MPNLRDRTLPEIDRFWMQVDKNGPIHPIYGQCWTWKGGLKGRKGKMYGHFRVGGKRTRATYYSYTKFVGDVPEGHGILHRCDNPVCVNPAHLFTGTNVENTADMVSKGRQSKGENRPASKLTEEDVRYIRKNYIARHPVFGAKVLAKKFDINWTLLLQIVAGRYWKHVV